MFGTKKALFLELVRAAFERYERALVGNDVETLNALFRDDPRTIRYGGGENLYGHNAIKAFRVEPMLFALAKPLAYFCQTSRVLTVFRGLQR